MSYQWIISYLKPYWKQVCCLIGCGLLITAIQLSITKFVQFFIDKIVPNAMVSTFIEIFILICILVILMIFAKAWRNKLQRQIQELASRDLMIAMFRHLRRLGFAFYEKQPIGKTIGLFQTEVTAAQNIFRQSVPGLIENVTSLCILLAFVISLSWQLSIWIIPFFFSYYLIGPYFEKKATIWAKEANKKRQLANKQIYDSIASIYEVRAYSAQDWSISRLINQYLLLHTTLLKQYFYAYSRGTVRRVTIGLGAVAVIAHGIWLVQHEHLSVGEFIAYLIIYFQLMFVITLVVTLMNEQQIWLQQLETLYNFKRQVPLVNEPIHPQVTSKIKGSIEFNNVSFSYPSRQKVINDFSLTVNPGEKVALVGTSGGGKSTILKLISRFYDPEDGEILLDGICIKEYSFAQLRSNIGYVFQDTYLFGGTVRENILFGNPNASSKDIEAASRAANAHNFIMELSNGYDTIIGERGVTLSGGQKQRIAIARMFIKNPTIVLLDEATSSLDNISESEVQKALDLLLSGRTTIAIAHRLSTINHFDKIVVVDDGQNAEQGKFEELLLKGRLLRKIVHGDRLEGSL